MLSMQNWLHVSNASCRRRSSAMETKPASLMTLSRLRAFSSARRKIWTMPVADSDCAVWGGWSRHGHAAGTSEHHRRRGRRVAKRTALRAVDCRRGGRRDSMLGQQIRDELKSLTTFAKRPRPRIKMLQFIPPQSAHLQIPLHRENLRHRIAGLTKKSRLPSSFR